MATFKQVKVTFRIDKVTNGYIINETLGEIGPTAMVAKDKKEVIQLISEHVNSQLVDDNEEEKDGPK